VSVVQVGGTPSYARDGKIYQGGLGGGELEEAVRGNPEAEQHARDYRAGTISGLVSVLVGGVGMCVGVGLLAADGAARDHNSGRQISGAALAGGGLAAYIAGLVLVINAQPHMWDAINIYNDGVRPPPAPPSRPRPALPLAAPTVGPTILPPPASPVSPAASPVSPAASPVSPAASPVSPAASPVSPAASSSAPPAAVP
jgi:hypothetical protein